MRLAACEKEDRKMKAAEMMGRFLSEIKEMVQGVHLMPLGWADIVLRCSPFQQDSIFPG
jgi:methylenetetrahydrofolate reductase (NADPH)